MEKNERILIDKMYREMFKRLWIYAKRQLEDDGLAEEAVQETFRIVCEKNRQVLESENPKGWIVNALKYTILTINATGHSCTNCTYILRLKIARRR
ncbi:MAG: hypothetical protein IJO77_01550 [Oscillospiraceae bacterium]|nr:hypothetical protein [Oscillospiraceae bacterium]